MQKANTYFSKSICFHGAKWLSNIIYPTERSKLLRAIMCLKKVGMLSFCVTLSYVSADELRYEAHWSDGSRPSLHTAPLSRDQFLESGQELAEAGFVLVDAETAIKDGQRLFAGLFTTGTGSTIFEGPMGPIKLRERMNARRAQGMRLVDFEIFRRENGSRRYIGVWRPGSGEEIVTRPMREDAFFARGKRHIENGLRLRDVEVEVIDDTLFYSGLFRSGAGLNALTPPQSLRKFQRTKAAMLAQGQELRDMERIGGSTNKRFVGVWASGDDDAEITSPRSFGQHFILASNQFNSGRQTRDFELQVIRSSTPSGGGGANPSEPPEMPQNPSYVRFSGNENLRLILDFTHTSDAPFTLQIPRNALPDWLPKTAEGEPILPDADCGLSIRRASSIFWQVLDNPEFSMPPFNAIPMVSDLGSEFFLGGVHFSGPILGCFNTQKAWVFPQPFTRQGPFMPLENLSLVVEFMQSSEIDFIKDTGPQPKPIDVDKLFKDDSLKKLKKQLKFWDSLFKQGKNIDKYCPTIGSYWKKLCSQFPDSDSVCSEEVKDLPDC